MARSKSMAWKKIKAKRIPIASMGQIFSHFRKPKVDFDSVSPPSGNEELEVLYKSLTELLQSESEACSNLKKYEGNSDVIRKSMSNPKDADIQAESFTEMFPNVDIIKSLYLLSQETNTLVHQLIVKVSSIEGDRESKEALLKGLASLLEKVFDIDWAKMHKPEIQNDFSFYRRSLEKHGHDPNVPVDDSVAGSVSMFVAYPNPFVRSMVNSLNVKKSEHPEIVPFLSDFANLCAASASAKGKLSEDSKHMLIAAMTVSIVLYDELDPHGAFSKRGKVDIKRCINCLKAWASGDKVQYMNTLKYSTRTFNTAPGSISKLLED